MVARSIRCHYFIHGWLQLAICMHDTWAMTLVLFADEDVSFLLRLLLQLLPLSLFCCCWLFDFFVAIAVVFVFVVVVVMLLRCYCLQMKTSAFCFALPLLPFWLFHCGRWDVFSADRPPSTESHQTKLAKISVKSRTKGTRASFSSYFKVSSIHTFTKKLEKKWSLCSSFQIHREVESEGYQQAASCVSLLLIHPTPLLRSLSTFDFHALCIHLILKLGFNLPQFVFADLDSNLKISGRIILEYLSNSHGQYVLYVQHDKPSSVESDIINFISDFFHEASWYHT